MAGFENDIGFAKNFDFTQSDNQAPTESNGLISNGQMWIGSNSLNAGGTHINVGRITSPLGTLTIGYTSPNITLDLASGADLHVARFIVASSTSGTGANYTTIASAITGAVATGINSTIFIQPGIYTENLTLPANINLCAFECDASTPNVTIVGTITCTSAGTRSISGIRLQTNSAALLAVTGTLATIVNLNNCYLNCSNATGITFSTNSASAAINIYNCQGNLGTTGIGLFAHSSAGTLLIAQSDFTNTGLSQTANTASLGTLAIRKSVITNPITTSSTNAFIAETSTFSTEAQNVTAITTGGSGTQELNFCGLASGSASAISVGSATLMTDTTIKSTNTNAVTGASTLSYSNLTFTSTSSLMNTTTQTAMYTNLGKYKASGQPSFSAYLASDDLNQTGDGTTYTLGTSVAFTELFDIGSNFNTNGTFTAPVAGKYMFMGNVRVFNILATMTIGQILFVASGNTYFSNALNAAVARTVAVAADIVDFKNSIIVNMAAGDTCVMQISLGGGTKTADINGLAAPNISTYFQGYQIG